jgi:hypothetical protein
VEVNLLAVLYLPIEADVAIAHIVGHDEYDVGLSQQSVGSRSAQFGFATRDNQSRCAQTIAFKN